VDDLVTWLRAEIAADLDAAQSGAEQVARTASHPGGLVTAELREDLRSFCESFPYLIRVTGRGEPIRCECCGTLVALTPEAHGANAPWKPAIWEHESLRKHTMRRCDWKRGGL
jgi:hypothetical protein